MSDNRIDIIIDDDRWTKLIKNADEWAEEVFETALSYLQEQDMGWEIGFDKPIIVTLDLNNDAEVQKLNAEFRGKDKPTNVLSFANIDDDEFVNGLEEADEIELGDIIIALETLEAEAEQKGILLKDHFAHLLIHGILHLFGYDHQDDDEADEMEGIEIQILQNLNIRNPYEEQ